jgi:hypothetical protein
MLARLGGWKKRMEKVKICPKAVIGWRRGMVPLSRTDRLTTRKLRNRGRVSGPSFVLCSQSSSITTSS